MVKYKYHLENEIVETFDLNTIPEGVEYETIEFELPNTKYAEIEAIRQQTSLEITEYMREHKEKFIFRQIEIPQYAWEKYDEMRAEYQIKKQSILNR